MGCCQSTYETGELLITNFQDRADTLRVVFNSDDGFAEISLESRSEETDLNPRYTEQHKIKELVGTMRSTSYSMHRTELEQSFLQTKINVFYQLE